MGEKVRVFDTGDSNRFLLSIMGGCPRFSQSDSNEEGGLSQGCQAYSEVRHRFERSLDGKERNMPGNHLEDLVAEWYEFQGYFVRRNVPVGKRPQGGYECELDIVAFNPATKHLAHIEPSLDAESWRKREARFSKKFAAGRRYIPGLFPGFELPKHVEQVAILVFASKVAHQTIGGGKIMLARELVPRIVQSLRNRRLSSSAVPEHLPLIRTLQFAIEYWEPVREALGK